MSEISDYWVISDRVLSPVAGGGLVEAPLALKVAAPILTRVIPAQEARKADFLDAERIRGVEIIDVGSSPIVPSFVNAHTHLALAPLRGIAAPRNTVGDVVVDVFFQMEQHLTAEDVRVFTKMGAYESMFAGVGEVWDHYYFGLSVADALLEVGLPGVVAPTLQDELGPGRHSWETQLVATEKIAGDPRYRAGGVRAAVGPHASDTVSRSLFERASSLARRLAIPVHFHFLQSAAERRTIESRYPRGGAIELSELFSGTEVVIAHGLYLSESDIVRLAGNGWLLAYCPFSQLQFGYLGPLASWTAHGGAWAIGTDCVASNDALSPGRELPLIFSDAALRTSFSQERKGLLSRGDLVSAEAVEALRQRNLSASKLGDIETLLRGAWGMSLSPFGEPSSRGLVEGALASFLVLNQEHPCLFPGTDLPRSVALGDFVGAIEWAVVGGQRLGQEEGLQRAILQNPAYKDTVYEARRRKAELFTRAGIT